MNKGHAPTASQVNNVLQQIHQHFDEGRSVDSFELKVENVFDKKEAKFG
jgi:hypothetical protein